MIIGVVNWVCAIFPQNLSLLAISKRFLTWKKLTIRLFEHEHTCMQTQAKISTIDLEENDITVCWWKRYLIAGNIHWVQSFTIFTDRPASAKIKTMKKLRWKLMMSSCVYIDTNWCLCKRDGFLQSVCPLNNRCREESACYHKTCQQTRMRRSEVVEAKISSAEFFCSTASFSPTVAVLILS